MLCENLPLIIVCIFIYYEYDGLFLIYIVKYYIFQEFDEKSPNGLNAVTLTTIKTQQNVNKHLIKLLTQKERG